MKEHRSFQCEYKREKILRTCFKSFSKNDFVQMDDPDLQCGYLDEDGGYLYFHFDCNNNRGQ